MLAWDTNFLRHIMRCKLLLFVLDVAGSEGRDPLDDLASLRRELSLYNPSLGERPWLIVANKIDLPEAQTQLTRLRKRFRNAAIVPVAAAQGDGIQELKELLRTKLLAGPMDA